ncbi:MAG: sporulation protein YunB [Bacilli bacterium]|nr:sporulation protein YunB [Bacilli bacterium]
MFKTYSKYTASKVNLISEEYFQKEIYSKLNDMVYNSMSKNDINDILEIYKNSEGEILYVDYDLNKSYELLNVVSNKIKSSLNPNSNLSTGIVYEIPFLIGSKSVFLSNLGPKITIKMNYINSILTNVYTKITNYGLNNALVEAYIKITIEGRIITPVSSERKRVSYDLLISSKIINGRIPEFYGNYLSSNSSIFDVPIE